MMLTTQIEESGLFLHEKLKASLTRNHIPFTEHKEENTVVVYISMKHYSLTEFGSEENMG